MLSSCYLVRKTLSTAWREKCPEKEEIRVCNIVKTARQAP